VRERRVTIEEQKKKTNPKKKKCKDLKNVEKKKGPKEGNLFE